MADTYDYANNGKEGRTGRTNHREQLPDSSATSPTVTVPYAESGALINRTETADERWARLSANSGLAWPRFRHYLRKPFSEFMGTFILIMFGDGVVAQVVLSGDANGNYQSINWGWVSSLPGANKEASG